MGETNQVWLKKCSYLHTLRYQVIFWIACFERLPRKDDKIGEFCMKKGGIKTGIFLLISREDEKHGSILSQFYLLVCFFLCAVVFHHSILVWVSYRARVDDRKYGFCGIRCDTREK